MGTPKLGPGPQDQVGKRPYSPSCERRQILKTRRRGSNILRESIAERRSRLILSPEEGSQSASPGSAPMSPMAMSPTSHPISVPLLEHWTHGGLHVDDVHAGGAGLPPSAAYVFLSPPEHNQVQASESVPPEEALVWRSPSWDAPTWDTEDSGHNCEVPHRETCPPTPQQLRPNSIIGASTCGNSQRTTIPISPLEPVRHGSFPIRFDPANQTATRFESLALNGMRH